MGSTLVKPKTNDDNPESLSLIWLDSCVDTSKENIVVQNALRLVINYIKTFNNEVLCEAYIRSIPDDDQIFLIVNGKLGQLIVPNVHALKQIHSIYVFCFDKELHQKWSWKFSKVRSVFTERNQLIHAIEIDRMKWKNTDQSILFSIQGSSTNELNGEFIHTQVFLDVLLRIKSTPADKTEFISRCQKMYKENENELKSVKEFKKYTADKAIWWYTRESFVNRLLNKALRVKNTDLLFLFRFFIADLNQQLIAHRYTSPVRLYRCQNMSKEERKILHDSIGKYMSINCFLSTSTNRTIAMEFLGNKSDDLEQILFEIDVNPTITSKPVANITHLSANPKEEEVLIMLGSIFQIVDVRDDDQIWIINMKLCSDEDHNLKDIVEYLIHEHGIGEQKLLSFGNVLANMGKYDEAERYYHQLINEIYDNDHDLARCYHGLGNVTDERGDFQSSIKWHEKSLKLQLKQLNPTHPYLAPNHISIGCAYFNKGDYQQALKSYIEAYEILKRSFGEHHLDVAMCFNNIACVYEREKKYSWAYEYHIKALNIRLELLPEYHPDLAQSHHNIGNIYRSLHFYDLALQQYEISLSIKKKTLPSHHREIGLTLENIANIYVDKGDFTQALRYYDDAVSVYCHSLPPTHQSVLQIQEYIEKLSSSIENNSTNSNSLYH